MVALRQLYDRRVDLQEAYPEAGRGDMARLVNWAAGVSRKKWKDSAYDTLKLYAGLYVERQVAAPEVEIPWPTVLRTSQAAANPVPLTLATMQDRRADDISSHLMTLALVITEFGLKEIVELGTRDGNSTLALLEAARAIGGHVTSVDVEPCLLARQRVAQAGLSTLWTFLEADDMQLSPPQIPAVIDFLFLDTTHLYEPTKAELKKYFGYLRDGSWIALHDYVSFTGVNRALDDFVKALEPKPRFYCYTHQNGLALLRVCLS
jgi:predicted O-methyltransferase YrrM